MPMPPIPPKKVAAPKGRGTARRTPDSSRESSILEELGINPEGSGSSGPDSPSREPLPKGISKPTPTEKKLEEKIARFYKMVGAIIKPFKRWFPPVEILGDGFKTFSDDAAEAWMEVARDDPKIRKRLEEWTSVSAWGNLVGVHISIFEKALAKQMETMGIPTPPQTEDIGEVLNYARNMGLDDNQIDQALKLAGFNINGPGDTIRTGGVPIPDVDTVNAQASRIQSADQLGVTRDGQQESSPMRTGGIK